MKIETYGDAVKAEKLICDLSKRIAELEAELADAPHDICSDECMARCLNYAGARADCEHLEQRIAELEAELGAYKAAECNDPHAWPLVVKLKAERDAALEAVKSWADSSQANHKAHYAALERERVLIDKLGAARKDYSRCRDTLRIMERDYLARIKAMENEVD